MNLGQIQQRFCAAIHDSSTSDVLSNGADLWQETGISSAAGLDLYRHNHRGTLQQALAQIYPVCVSILGKRPFNRMATQYQQTHPAHHWNLDLYGEEFPHLLSSLCQQHQSLADLQYLSELATLEWYWHAAYYAPDSPVLNLQQSAMMEGELEDFQIKTLPGVYILRTTQPIYEIWSAHRASKATAEFIARETPQQLLIWRKDYTVQVDEIEPSIFDLLKVCKTPSDLHYIMENYTVEYISKGIQQGWLSISQRQTNDDINS